jgi:hypothetical protein
LTEETTSPLLGINIALLLQDVVHGFSMPIKTEIVLRIKGAMIEPCSITSQHKLPTKPRQDNYHILVVADVDMLLLGVQQATSESKMAMLPSSSTQLNTIQIFHAKDFCKPSFKKRRKKP